MQCKFAKIVLKELRDPQKGHKKLKKKEGKQQI